MGDPQGPKLGHHPGPKLDPPGLKSGPIGSKLARICDLWDPLWDPMGPPWALAGPGGRGKAFSISLLGHEGAIGNRQIPSNHPWWTVLDSKTNNHLVVLMRLRRSFLCGYLGSHVGIPMGDRPWPWAMPRG